MACARQSSMTVPTQPYMIPQQTPPSEYMNSAQQLLHRMNDTQHSAIETAQQTGLEKTRDIKYRATYSTRQRCTTKSSSRTRGKTSVRIIIQTNVRKDARLKIMHSPVRSPRTRQASTVPREHKDSSFDQSHPLQACRAHCLFYNPSCLMTNNYFSTVHLV